MALRIQKKIPPKPRSPYQWDTHERSGYRVVKIVEHCWLQYRPSYTIYANKVGSKETIEVDIDNDTAQAIALMFNRTYKTDMREFRGADTPEAFNARLSKKMGMKTEVYQYR